MSLAVAGFALASSFPLALALNGGACAALVGVTALRLPRFCAA
jgi:hypothetical protein